MTTTIGRHADKARPYHASGGVAKTIAIPLIAIPLIALMAILAPSASAASAGPGWAIDSVALPSNFSADDTKICEVTEEVCDLLRGDSHQHRH